MKIVWRRQKVTGSKRLLWELTLTKLYHDQTRLLYGKQRPSKAKPTQERSNSAKIWFRSVNKFWRLSIRRFCARTFECETILRWMKNLGLLSLLAGSWAWRYTALDDSSFHLRNQKSSIVGFSSWNVVFAFFMQWILVDSKKNGTLMPMFCFRSLCLSECQCDASVQEHSQDQFCDGRIARLCGEGCRTISLITEYNPVDFWNLLYWVKWRFLWCLRKESATMSFAGGLIEFKSCLAGNGPIMAEP